MPNWTKPTPRPTQVGLLLFDQFSNLCLANCIEPLRAANDRSPTRVFDWTILTPNGAPCQSSSGMDVIAQGMLEPAARYDYLFVLASYGYEHHDTADTRTLLRQGVRYASVVVGLDAAPWLLASAGLLDGRRATVHWDLLEAFTERFLSVDVERARVVRDGSIMTCAGAMSALDLTLDLIADQSGEAARYDVQTLFLHGDPPVGAEQTSHRSDPLVQRALQRMRDTVETPLTLPELALSLSCQPRTLDRRFRARLGASPGQVYRHLRLAAARKLIENSPLGIAEIAVRCGYESPAALTRAIGRHYGATPRSLRRG